MATIQEQYHREADGLLWRQRQQELAVELLAAEREIGGRDPRPDDEVRMAAEQDELMRRYTEVARQGQDAVLTAVDAWTRAVEDAAGKLPTLTTYPDYHQVIDQVYDFAAHALNVHRSFTTSVLSSTASFAGSVTERATAAAQDAAETVTTAAAKKVAQ